ncbi:MAG TPA: hypothetical protein VEI07_26710 [Planctomycetaceae bacterium]|nr:hypothetical protein [Planctomycetaceae bacterium]
MDVPISPTGQARPAPRSLNPATRKIEFVLPRSALGRCVFGVVCLLLLPLSADMLWVLLVDVPLWPLGPAAPVGKIFAWIVVLIFVVLFEYMSVGLFIFSLFGLAWSIARPEWAERALQAGSRKMARGGKWALYSMLGLFCVLGICATAGLF